MQKSTIHRRRSVAGFDLHSLVSKEASVSIAPALGGRVVSMRDRVSGREWLDGWQPAAKRRIWHPSDPSDFSSGPGAGIDECLPTVLPCRYGRRKLPDHGELWNTPAGVDADFAKAGVLASQWRLQTLPLAFERRITLHRNHVTFDYRLENLANTPTPFLWAWHPLFSWKRGDEIRLPPSIDTCLTGDGRRLAWPEHEAGCDLSRATFPTHAVPAAKVFIGPMIHGGAEIHAANGARLTLKWPGDLFPYAGIWITRGFWKGLHHWAIEPTNAPVDRLSDFGASSRATHLDAQETREWRLMVGLSV